MKQLKNFLHDEDGMSARDFLMLSFIGIYLLQQTICFVLALTDNLPKEAKVVMEGLEPLVITIVGAVFSVTVVQEFKKNRSEPIEIEAVQKDSATYPSVG